MRCNRFHPGQPAASPPLSQVSLPRPNSSDNSAMIRAEGIQLQASDTFTPELGSAAFLFHLRTFGSRLHVQKLNSNEIDAPLKMSLKAKGGVNPSEQSQNSRITHCPLLAFTIFLTATSNACSPLIAANPRSDHHTLEAPRSDIGESGDSNVKPASMATAASNRSNGSTCIRGKSPLRRMTSELNGRLTT